MYSVNTHYCVAINYSGVRSIMTVNGGRRRRRRQALSRSLSLPSASLSIAFLFFSIADGFSNKGSDANFSILTSAANDVYLSTEPLDEKKHSNHLTNAPFPFTKTNTRDQSETTMASRVSDHLNTSSASAIVCQLKAIDPHISNKIIAKIYQEQINLLEYQLNFPNYTVNPLLAISMYAYRLDNWARASSRHGQTLLSLAFNYGILSLRTLTFGTDLLTVEMQDIPDGCVAAMNETQVVDQLLFLLSRDFKDMSNEVTLQGEERICHEIIVNADGYAKFKDQCFKKGPTGQLVETQVGNFWIHFLHILLVIVRFGILFFGPLLLTSLVAQMSKKSFPYIVKLKESLRKRVLLSDNKTKDYGLFSSEKTLTLNLSNVRGFPKFKAAVEKLPHEKPFEAQITQYDILVSYKRLLTENRVPVGLWRSLGRMIFHCKIRNVGPFRKCCEVNMFKGCCCKTEPTPWSQFWRKVGIILMIICIPIPWYFRLWVFNTHEYPEVISRKEATAKVGLKEGFDNSLIHYFTPEHWIFNSIYILYIVSAVILAYTARGSEDRRFRRILTGSFSDLENLSWIRVFEMLVGNLIWPLERYGLCGLFVGFVYWPIVVPLSVIVFILYTLPLTYIIFRMFFYSNRVFLEKLRKLRTETSYRNVNQKDETIRIFETSFHYCPYKSEDSRQDFDPDNLDKVQSTECNKEITATDDIGRSESKDVDVEICSTDRQMKTDEKFSLRLKRFCLHLIASTLCSLSLISYLVIMSECIGCLVEIMVFTLMGIIVNAGTLLKYVSLVILVVVYSYDSFNNVEKKYLKMNKALFSEVKGRIKDLDKVTSLPSHLQENRGFKSQELNEQQDYEKPDDVTQKPSEHWMLNDLVLFVDNEDMPRIPKKLFDEVCQIRVAGVPGPIYRGLLFGVRQFLKIALFIFFVFVVVLSFGDVYKISSTNQMLATLAGGFLPVILRQFMEPERPDIEIGTVSFKSKLDEIIKNFNQVWPIYDFPLEEVVAGQDETTEKEEKADDNAHSKQTENASLQLDSETENERNPSLGTERKVTFEESAVGEVDPSSKVDWIIYLTAKSLPDTKSNGSGIKKDHDHESWKLMP